MTVFFANAELKQDQLVRLFGKGEDLGRVQVVLSDVNEILHSLAGLESVINFTI